MTALGPLLLALTLGAQTPAPPTPAPAAPALAAPSLAEPQAGRRLRAQYQWGYAGADGEGKGILSVLLEPASGRTILEIQGLGERLMLLEGDASAGYRVQIPRRHLDQRAPTLGAVPLPFFPQVATAATLFQLLSEGSGPGVKVTRRDPKGPVKLRYQGVDDRGKEVLVWLERTRWELEASK